MRDRDSDVHDRAALIGFLKSPFVGVRDDTLVALAQNPAGLRWALRKEKRERALLDRACALLDRFGRLRDRLPHGQLLQRLLAESGFEASLTLDEVRGPQALANIAKLIRLAADAGDLSLGEWLTQIAERRDSDLREPQERLYRERANVVTISSIHSAKGLEWPVVFWCDTIRKGSNNFSPLLRGREVFRVKDPAQLDEEGEVRDLVSSEFAADLALESEAEAYRLWYVAATRPRQLLVISGIALSTTVKKASAKNVKKRPQVFTGSPAKLICETFAAALSQSELPDVIEYKHTDGTAFRMRVVAVKVHETESVGIPAFTSASIDALNDLLAPPPLPTQHGRRRLSATQLMQFARSADDTPSQRRGAPAKRSVNIADVIGSALAGTIVHDVLEHWSTDRNDLTPLIDAAILRHAGAAFAPEGQTAIRTHVGALVERVVQHPRWREVASATSARRELRFTRVLPDGSTIEGALDLAAVLDGETVIVDVKSGEVSDGASLAETYGLQGATYTEAAQSIAGGRAARFELLQAADGLVVPADQPPEALQAVVARLRTAG